MTAYLEANAVLVIGGSAAVAAAIVLAWLANRLEGRRARHRAEMSQLWRVARGGGRTNGEVESEWR